MEVQKMFLAVMWGIFEGPVTNSGKPTLKPEVRFHLELAQQY